MKTLEEAITEAYNEVTKEDFTPESTQEALEKLAADVKTITLEAEERYKMWLNAFRCVSPSDEFAAEVGHDIIKYMMESPRPEPDEFGLRPFRQIHFTIGCS